MSNNIFLSTVIYNLTKQVNNLHKEIEKREKKINKLKDDIDQKLNKARNVHQKLLPDKIVEPKDIYISSYYQPAEYMGGDYYNIIKIDHGKMNSLLDQYLIYFLDVSGHGIDSTLLAIFINQVIENYFVCRHNPGEQVSPSDLMSFIDHKYQKEGFPDNYLVCLFLGLLDLNNYQLTYSTAGLQFPLYQVDSQNRVIERKTGELPISTGLNLINEGWPEREIKLNHNNQILFSTDGLLEQSREGHMYHKRIKSVLSQYSFLPPVFLEDILLDDFNNFKQGKINDDITFLLLGRPKGNIESREVSENENPEKIITWLHEKFDNSFPRALEKLKSYLLIFFKSDNVLDVNLKFRLLDNEHYVVMTVEENTGNINFQDLIPENKTELSNLSCKSSLKLEHDKLYSSYNNFYNKIYFLILKKDKHFK